MLDQADFRVLLLAQSKALLLGFFQFNQINCILLSQVRIISVSV